LSRVYNWCRQNNPDTVLQCVFGSQKDGKGSQKDGKGFFSVVLGTSYFNVGCKTNTGYFCVQSVHDKKISFIFASTDLFNKCNTNGEMDFVIFSCDAKGNETGNIVGVNMNGNEYSISNYIHSLDVFSLKKIKSLQYNNNLFITNLKLSSSLTSLEIANTALQPQLQSLLAKVPNLQFLDCNDMNLTELDVSGLAQLQSLDCSGNQGLISLNLSNCIYLNNLGSIIVNQIPTISGTLTITNVPGSNDPTFITQAENKGWTVKR
jgi:hypothetical protein